MRYPTNKTYDSNIHNWNKTDAFLTGDNVEAYLLKGVYEKDGRFKKRVQLTDFQPITRQIISRLSGMVSNTQNIEITGTDILPDDFLNTAGQNDESFRVMMKRLSSILFSFNDGGVVVHPGPRPRISIHKPQLIPRWIDSRVVVVESMRKLQATIKEPESSETVYVIYKPDSWEMVKVKKEGSENVITTIDKNDYDHTFIINGVEVSPAMRVTFGFSTAIGVELAKTHEAIYRMESAVDAGTYEAIVSSTIQAAVGSNEELAKEFVKALKEKQGYLPYSKDVGEHKPLALPTGPLDIGINTIERKKKAMMKALGGVMDEISNRSATEANIRSKSGLESTLSIAASNMESIEENILRRVAQASNTSLTQSQLEQITVTYPLDFMD